MLSTNIDLSQDANSRDTETLDVETLLTKQSLRNCEENMLESTTTSSLLSSVSSYKKKVHNTSVLSANYQALSSNLLTKLQGQRWQQYFDFERVLKQMRCAEKANLKIMDMEHHMAAVTSNSNSKPISSVSSVVLNQKSKQTTQKQKQVKRLSGCDMQYYGLAPKQKALEIVICNVCKGIYTKVGFNNHMFLQHPDIWNTASTKACGKAEELSSNSVPDSRKENMGDIEHIEATGISLESSATSSCIMSTSSSQASSAFGCSTRAVKGNRTSSGSTSNNGRPRCKVSKTQQLPESTSTHTMECSPQSMTQLVLSSSCNLKSFNSIKLSSKTIAANTPITTASIQSNVTVKMLPTFGVTSSVHTNNTPTSTVVSSSGSFSHSSNSSTSSSSISSITSKSSNQSKISSLSFTFPNSLPLPITEVSNNVTTQLEMVSSSTPFYIGSKDKGRANVHFNTDSFEKTDENATIACLSDLRVLTSASSTTTPKLGASSNTDLRQSSDFEADPKVNNVTLGSVKISNTKTDEYYQLLPVPHNYRTDNVDLSLSSESIISSTADILQATNNTMQIDNSLIKVSCNLERLQMSTVSTTRISPTLTLSKSTPYVKMATKIATQNSSANKFNFDKICGVSVADEFGSLPCARSLTCGLHSHFLKRQVPGRSKPFDDLLAYCSFKEGKDTLVGQEINTKNSLASGRLDGRCVFATLVGVPNLLSTLNEVVLQNKASSDNLSTKKIIKPKSEKCINYQNLQEGSNFEANMPLCYTTSHASAQEKSKVEPSTVASNNVSQVQMQSSERFCDEQVQNKNSSDENSILTLESIFDHNTQLEMLDSKFITEILNTAESDINFDDIVGSSTPTLAVQARVHQPAIKIVRVEDTSSQQTLEIEKTFSSFETQQLHTFVADKETVLNHTIKIKSNNVYDGSLDQHDRKEINTPYQTDLKNVLQEKELEQTTAVEAMQCQQLLYQQCSLHNVDNMIFNQQQHQKQQHMRDNRSKEEIDLSIEEEVLKAKNLDTLLSINNVSSDIKGKDAITFSEYDIDEDSYEEMERNFSIFNVPSLSDDNNEVITVKSSFEFSANSQPGGVEQHGSSTEDDNFFEVTTDNSVTMHQNEVIAKLLNQRDFKIVADVHLSNSNNSKMSDKSAVLTFDFSLIESPKSLTLTGKNLEPKARTSHKQNLDQAKLNINLFNYVPRPLNFNNFALIKFPLSLATVFRRDLLSSRKANNNIITLTGNGSSFLGNCTNGCFVGGHPINIRNSTKHISNVSSLNSNVSVSTNSINEFSIGNVLVSNSVNSTLPKHQRNDNVVQNNVPGSNSTTPSSSNGIMIANRFPKNILNNSTCSYPSANGKSKVFINTAAPIAVISPSRLSNSGQISKNTTFSNSNSNFGRLIQISSETDRINLIKRSSITKPITVNSTIFKPRIITELLLRSGSSAANFVGVLNGNCDNAVKSYTIKYYRNKSLYAKRTILKLSQHHGGIQKSSSNIFREKKHKALQKVFC